ncbi:FAD-dependent oxidoreductase [Amycolatopsis jejuensis]|uniref:FAD-dependent oxidoreductase n=1 Tax=Amycolatopsis jejuensis TaxID=330084 RepID=UPI000526C450|nr:FAD-dependent oxidoreductase [Amycolatopsis jejuensis]
MTRDVLVCGAGIAGSTLAFWLARNGFRVTVVERAPGGRSSGNPVDVRGRAMEVAEAMGVVPRLREVATHARRLRLLAADGREITTVRTPVGKEIEVPRADLATVLYEAARDDAEFRFDDTITALQQDAGGVDVTFDRAAPRRFDLVVGADGVHSVVRRLVFGGDFARYAGLYVATVAFGESSEYPHDVVMLNTPGRLVAIHPGRGNSGVAFIFRAPEGGRGKEIVSAAYRDLGWRVPELLARFEAADDVFFDEVSVVDPPSWSRGRVALVGDAASCVSLLGDGSSLAIAGAHTLATSLVESNAFARYEAIHRARVTPKRRGVRAAAAALVPKTSAGLAVRNLAARLLPG